MAPRQPSTWWLTRPSMMVLQQLGTKECLAPQKWLWFPGSRCPCLKSWAHTPIWWVRDNVAS
eukprot:scaffold65994_cov18-Tisochrysis_lutea.AAC.1